MAGISTCVLIIHAVGKQQSHKQAIYQQKRETGLIPIKRFSANSMYTLHTSPNSCQKSVKSCFSDRELPICKVNKRGCHACIWHEKGGPAKSRPYPNEFLRIGNPKLHALAPAWMGLGPAAGPVRPDYEDYEQCLQAEYGWLQDSPAVDQAHVRFQVLCYKEEDKTGQAGGYDQEGPGG